MKTSAFAERYGSGNLQKWSPNIYVKTLNDLTSYSDQIFLQNPLFFVIQDCINQRNISSFMLRSCLAKIFFSSINAQANTLVKVIMLRKKKQFVSELFSQKY